MVSCPPDDFHHLVEEVDLQEATEAGACTGRKQAMQITKGLLQVLLYEQGGLEHPGLCPTHAGKLLHFLEGGMAVALLLHRGEGMLLQGQLAEKFAQVVQSHNFAVERGAQRQAGAAGLQMQVHKVLDDASTLGAGNPDESGNSRLIGNKELSSTPGVGCSGC